MTTYPAPLWGKPSYTCSAWDSYTFSAFDQSVSAHVVELGAVHRAPSLDLVLVQLGKESVFLTPEDAEHFAAAVLTVVTAAKQKQPDADAAPGEFFYKGETYRLAR